MCLNVTVCSPVRGIIVSETFARRTRSYTYRRQFFASAARPELRSLAARSVEFVDPASRRTYVARQPASPGAGYTDYGYFAELEGPRQQRIVVIAGARDLGVMQTAEAVTRADSVASLAAAAGGASAFESLMEVEGVAHASMNTKRLFVAPIKGAAEGPRD